MSGLDVEALLESAANKASSNQSKENESNERSERNGSERPENYHRERGRDFSRERHPEPRRREIRAEKGWNDRADGDQGTRSHHSDRHSTNGSTRSGQRGSRIRESDRRRSRRDRRGRELADPDHYSRSGGDFYRGGGDYRSRSRSPEDVWHYRPHGRSRRGRPEDRDLESERAQSRRGRRDSVSARPSKTPEPAEADSDRRTIFVQQLAARLRTKELIAFFERVGPVKEAQIVKDRVSNRSKGVGYVEFVQQESVPLAIQLTGQLLLGIPIIAQLTEAEKNRQARTIENTQRTATGTPFHKLYVGNIHFSITQNDLQTIFEPFGELDFVQLHKEQHGRSKGYGFVQFRDPFAAKEALEQMNGFELAGRAIRVGLGNEKLANEPGAQVTKSLMPNGPLLQDLGFDGLPGHVPRIPESHVFDHVGNRSNDKGSGGASALDDTDVAGVNFNNFSRDALMRKLARTDRPTDEFGTMDRNKMARPNSDYRPPVPNTAQASRCVVLRNMFDPTQETGDNWAQELADDVRQECESKYGEVVHIAVDPNTQGDIYVKFKTFEGGENAINGLNGRYFGGRQISTQPVVDLVYNSLFRTKDL